MIDLHIHTTHSDGLDSLKNVLIKAESLGLNTISITDHDTCRAYNELEDNDYHEIFTGNIMKGIEISSKYKGHKIELLAYNFDDYNLVNKVIVKDSYHTNKDMYKIIEKERIKLIDKFRELGLIVNLDFYNNLFIDAFESKLYNSIRDINDTNKMIEVLGDNYYNTGYQFYRKCVTSPESSFYIDYSVLNMDVGEICDFIHKIDGLVFLAHPYLYGMKDTMKELDNMYKNYDIDGIECYYNGFNKEQISNIEKFAHDNHLLTSGGSDYHAKPGFKSQLGCCMQGNSKISDDVINNWNVSIKPIGKIKKYIKRKN